MSNHPAATVEASANPWLSHNARIARITPETSGVATYDLVIDDVEVAQRFAFQPGQFNMIYLPGVGEVAISISGPPVNGQLPASASATQPIAHTIREAGNVTKTLAQMREGDYVAIRGPFGTAWPMQKCEGKDVILVAGGIGLAPLRPVVYEILAHRERYGNVSVLVGARSPDGLLYSEELAEWEESLTIRQTVDRATTDWNGHVGVVTALLDRLPIDHPENTVLMTCGPEVMMWYTIRTALSRGLSAESIWVSLERNMNCAIGLCGHCQMGPQFLCKDGPVFRYDIVSSILKVEAL